jgi:hypothetical protein
MTDEELLNKISEIKRKTVIINSLADIQEGLAVDIISLLKEVGGYRYESKKMINTIRKQTELFREDINRRYKGNEPMKENFGEITDMLKEFIYSLIEHKKNGEQVSE